MEEHLTPGLWGQWLYPTRRCARQGAGRNPSRAWLALGGMPDPERQTGGEVPITPLAFPEALRKGALHFQSRRIRDGLQRGGFLRWLRGIERDLAESRYGGRHHDVSRLCDVLLLATTESDRCFVCCLAYGDGFTAQPNAITQLGRKTPWQEIIAPIDFVLESRIMIWPGSLVQAQDRQMRQLDGARIRIKGLAPGDKSYAVSHFHPNTI